MKKKFALRADQIKRLVKNYGGCMASDWITVVGKKVGYMYREEPRNEVDSGWIFMAGCETQEYMDDAGYHGIYDVNTIANYDPSIIPFLDAPYNTAFERDDSTGNFVQVEGEPFEPGTTQDTQEKSWPPPGFPIVEGEYAITKSWSINLPQRFTRRIEDGQMVLWRPGFTIWISVWGNENGISQADRLKALKKSASPASFARHESKDQNLTRYCYRMRDEDENGQVESLFSFVIADNEQLQMVFYFDEMKDETMARQLFESIVMS